MSTPPRNGRSNEYVELRARSAFSFLEGASNPEDLVECAAELGYPALALGDRDGVYGIPRFHQAAVATGVRGIVGAEVTLDVSVPNGAGPSSPGLSRAEPRVAKRGLAPSLLLLVESPAGWKNLSRLLTVAQAGRPKGEAALSWEEIEEGATMSPENSGHFGSRIRRVTMST